MFQNFRMQLRHTDHTQKCEIRVIPTMPLLGMGFRSSNPGLRDSIHSRDTHKLTLDYKFLQILTLQCANEKLQISFHQRGFMRNILGDKVKHCLRYLLDGVHHDGGCSVIHVSTHQNPIHFRSATEVLLWESSTCPPQASPCILLILHNTLPLYSTSRS